VTARKRLWRVRLAHAAEADIQDIIRWTAGQFGAVQARRYAANISAALADLADGPCIAGVKSRDEILPGLMTLHIARKRRKGRHFIMFRTGKSQESEIIEALRLLHDTMDFPRHLPKDDPA